MSRDGAVDVVPVKFMPVAIFIYATDDEYIDIVEPRVPQ